MNIVTLTQENIDLADKVARKRRNFAVTNDYQAKNNAPTDYMTALSLDKLGMRTEMAAYKFLRPKQWDYIFSNQTHDHADFDGWIDIKGCRKDYHSLIVKKDYPEEWAYLLVSAEHHPIYNIIGWCFGYEAKKKRYFTDPTGCRPQAYFIKPNNPMIKPPITLKSLNDEKNLNEIMHEKNSN